MGRILGLDIGDVRIGIAISDELEITSQGLQTFKRKYLEKDIKDIKDIIESNEIKTIIIGLPKMLDGTIGVQAQKVIDFTNILKTKINVPVIFWDERDINFSFKNICEINYLLCLNPYSSVKHFRESDNYSLYFV